MAEKKSRKKLLIIFGVVALVLIAAGATTYFIYSNSHKHFERLGFGQGGNFSGRGNFSGNGTRPEMDGTMPSGQSGNMSGAPMIPYNTSLGGGQ